MVRFDEPEDFIRDYLEAVKAGCKTKIAIIKHMKISSETFYSYWNKWKMKRRLNPPQKDYNNPILIKPPTPQQIPAPELRDVTKEANDMIKVAYALHTRGIKEALAVRKGKKADYVLARRISLDALKIAKTQADIQRIFVAIGSVNIDNRSVNINKQVNVQLNDEMAKVWGLLCDKCRAKIKDVGEA